MSANQPRPTPNNNTDIQTRVMVDLIARRTFGIQKYGTALQPNNGRDALRDAYEEALDLTCYLRQMIAEREDETDLVVEMVSPVQASPDAAIYQSILESNLPQYARAAGYREGWEAALKAKADKADLTLAMQIDKARDQLATALRVVLAGIYWVFQDIGFTLPQTYDLRDIEQLLHDVGLKLAEFRRNKTELDMLRERADGNIWIWQGDGLDALESLTCPVIIRPEQLLEFYTKWIEPAEPGAPIPMILFCPRCGFQHIDEAQESCPNRTPLAPDDVVCGQLKGHEGPCTLASRIQVEDVRWKNPPHTSHLCGNCKLIWRQADVATTGVASIQTRGKADTWEPSSSGPALRMLEIGVEGDKFHPHDWNPECAKAGCVAMPPGWKSPYDRTEPKSNHEGNTKG